jgi:Domain of unknown function (DUF4159)
VRALAFVMVAGSLTLGASPATNPRTSRTPALVAETPQTLNEDVPREFYFTRGVFTSWGRGFGFGRGRPAWSTDYPRADEIFLSFLDRLLGSLDAFEQPHPVRFDDPNLRRYPFLYALEVGRMDLTPQEITALHDYLMAGGFLVIDDFWGSDQWTNFEQQMSLILPGYEIIDLPLDHPIFTSFYDIGEIIQVPNVRNGRLGGPTSEGDGIIPMVKGILHDSGELMVVINWNTDLGDAWEWADDPYYPLKYSTYAYQMGVNMIVYGMSH